MIDLEIPKASAAWRMVRPAKERSLTNRPRPCADFRRQLLQGGIQVNQIDATLNCQAVIFLFDLFTLTAVLAIFLAAP